MLGGVTINSHTPDENLEMDRNVVDSLPCREVVFSLNIGSQIKRILRRIGCDPQPYPLLRRNKLFLRARLLANGLKHVDIPLDLTSLGYIEELRKLWERGIKKDTLHVLLFGLFCTDRWFIRNRGKIWRKKEVLTILGVSEAYRRIWKRGKVLTS